MPYDESPIPQPPISLHESNPDDGQLYIRDKPITELTREEFYNLMNEALGMNIKPP